MYYQCSFISCQVVLVKIRVKTCIFLSYHNSYRHIVKYQLCYENKKTITLSDFLSFFIQDLQPELATCFEGLKSKRPARPVTANIPPRNSTQKLFEEVCWCPDWKHWCTVPGVLSRTWFLQDIWFTFCSCKNRRQFLFLKVNMAPAWLRS